MCNLKQGEIKMEITRAEKLGLKLDVEYIDDGYSIKILKK